MKSSVASSRGGSSPGSWRTNAASSRRSSYCASSPADIPTCISSASPGSCRFRPVRTAGRSGTATCSLTPITSLRCADDSAASARSCASSSSRAAGRNAAPTAASVTRRGVRSSSGLPSCASSRLSFRLTADCVVPSASAARVKLASSATSTNARTASRSSGFISNGNG
ncbi:transcriptional regulator, LysR family domain protein [Burkholderia pseudomallei]|nr:transcriptional regulator, LysR family domain protein [Burkholderia pseudomallei]